MRRSQAPVGNLKGSGVVAVAIDNDKNSQHALKWAADHMLIRGQIFYLLHVRRRIAPIPNHHGGHHGSGDVDDDVAATFMEQSDVQTRELILPFQCFCSRRGLQCKEVILDETDVPKAIVDFVQHRSIDKLVLGACSRSAILRTFKHADVPTSVCKTAPDFCTIYVISKGKISSVRPATRQNSTHNQTADPHDLRSTRNTSFQSIKSDPYARDNFETPRSSVDRSSGRSSFDRSSMLDYDERTSDKIKWLDGNENLSGSFASCPSPTRTDQPPAGVTRRDYFNTSGRKNSIPSNLDKNSFYEDASQSFNKDKDKTEDVETELIRLKLELKQKTEMSREEDYDDAFKRYSRESRSSNSSSSDSITGPKSRKPTPVPETREKRKLLEGFTSETPYRRYSTDEMDQATEFFSEALKVGEGGYGPVYKSTLDCTLVAIKALRSDVSTTQGLKQFQQELEVLSKIRHPNMVLLLGACPEYGCLIYEYMSNGSLEDRLSCLSGTPPLPWQLRFRVAHEVATGLLFLHQQRPEPLVHRDLKPANILLDDKMVAKIADVGLARLIPTPSEGMSSSVTSIYRMTAAAGTFCYIDPEYQKTGMVGTKSDVYALGIIFLQLITGRAPMGLAHNVANAIEEGKLTEFLDPNVPDWPVEETTRFAELALKCSELRRKDRPDLGSVVLPELRRLADFAEEKQDEKFVQQQKRCQSFKESAAMGSFMETKTVKGSSFAM